MLELLTPQNRIVVRQESSAIVLHGARDLRTMTELEPEPIAQRQGWKCVRQFPLGSWKEVAESAGALNPMEAEGVRGAGWGLSSR